MRLRHLPRDRPNRVRILDFSREGISQERNAKIMVAYRHFAIVQPAPGTPGNEEATALTRLDATRSF